MDRWVLRSKPGEAPYYVIEMQHTSIHLTRRTADEGEWVLWTYPNFIGKQYIISSKDVAHVKRRAWGIVRDAWQSIAADMATLT